MSHTVCPTTTTTTTATTTTTSSSPTSIVFFLTNFYACLRIRFLDVETNPGMRRPVPAVCRILFCNVLGLAGNLSDLTVASSQYDILLCSETLV